MRTDSVTIADSALREIAELVKQRLRRGVHARRGAPVQDPQRATRRRPTRRSGRRACCARRSAVAAVLDRDQLRLYTLIWQRTVATQMAEARFDQVGVDIEASRLPASEAASSALRPARDRADAHVRRVPEALPRGRDDEPDEDAEATLPELTAEQSLRMLEVLPEQHFTQPPPALHGGVAREEARGARASAGRPPTRRSSRRSRTAGTCGWRTDGSTPKTSATS